LADPKNNEHISRIQRRRMKILIVLWFKENLQYFIHCSYIFEVKNW